MAQNILNKRKHVNSAPSHHFYFTLEAKNDGPYTDCRMAQPEDHTIYHPLAPLMQDFGPKFEAFFLLLSRPRSLPEVSWSSTADGPILELRFNTSDREIKVKRKTLLLLFSCVRCTVRPTDRLKRFKRTHFRSKQIYQGRTWG